MLIRLSPPKVKGTNVRVECGLYGFNELDQLNRFEEEVDLVKCPRNCKFYILL